MTRFKAPLGYPIHTSGSNSRFAGMPAGMELRTDYYVFDPFALVSDVTMPSATAVTTGVDWTLTAVGASAISTSDDLVPPRLIFTTAAAENDGVQAQYTASTGAGEIFDLRSGKIRYMGCRFILTDANNNLATVQQCDFFLGLAITDTTVIAGCTDYIGFSKVDGTGLVNFVAGKNSTTIGDQISQSTSVTLVAADAGTRVAAGATAQVGAFHSFEFVAPDHQNVLVFADGQHISTVRSTTQLPDDEQLCPTLAFLTGEGVAKIMHVTKFIVAVEL